MNNSWLIDDNSCFYFNINSHELSMNFSSIFLYQFNLCRHFISSVRQPEHADRSGKNKDKQNAAEQIPSFDSLAHVVSS